MVGWPLIMNLSRLHSTTGSYASHTALSAGHTRFPVHSKPGLRRPSHAQYVLRTHPGPHAWALAAGAHEPTGGAQQLTYLGLLDEALSDR